VCQTHVIVLYIVRREQTGLTYFFRITVLLKMSSVIIKTLWMLN